MQAHHHQAARVAAGFKLGVSVAEQRDQFVVNDFNNLLPWLHAGEHLLAEGFFLHAGNEPLGHLEIYIRLQQRQAHFAQGFGDILLGDFAQPTQVFERAL